MAGPEHRYAAARRMNRRMLVIRRRRLQSSLFWVAWAAMPERPVNCRKIAITLIHKWWQGLDSLPGLTHSAPFNKLKTFHFEPNLWQKAFMSNFLTEV